MNLARKRAVIELLLAIGDHANDVVIPETATHFVGCERETADAADRAWRHVAMENYENLSDFDCAIEYTEAAYRLIESSPALIREWFGSGKYDLVERALRELARYPVSPPRGWKKRVLAAIDRAGPR